MRILEFKVNYEPEIASGVNLDADTAEDLAAAGHKVFLYVPTPTRGIPEEVTKSTPKDETKADGRLHIHRYSMYREGKSTPLRALRYVFCSLKQIWHGLLCPGIELVFAGSTPPIQGVIASAIKKARKIPFIYNCQDIFPDSMVTAGLTRRGSVAWKIGSWTAGITYRSADRIIVISNAMKKNLTAKGVPEEKIEVVSNWIDPSVIRPMDKDLAVKRLGIPEYEFTVVYAGNVGHAQGIETVIEAAEILRDDSRIGFVIFGAGACYDKIRNMAAQKGLASITFRPLLPYSRAAEAYSIGDACLVTCRPGTGANAMPSKVWSIMGCGRAVLASYDSGTDLDCVLSECGLMSPSGDAGKLAKNIVSLSADREMCERMGRNALAYVSENATRKVCTDRIVSLIEETRKGYERTCSR